MLAFSRLNDMSISFHTFALLLSKFPNLRTLSISINALSPLPPIESLSHSPKCSLGPLRFTALHEREVPDALEIRPLAEFLHAACPLVQCNANRGSYGRRVPELPQVFHLQKLLDSCQNLETRGELTLRHLPVKGTDPDKCGPRYEQYMLGISRCCADPVGS